MLIGHTDAGCTDLLNTNTGTFDLTRRHLIEWQRITLENRAVSVNQQQAQIVFLKEFADAFAKTAQIINGILMLGL